MGETLVYGIRVALAIAIATVFAAAIIVLVSGLTTLVFGSIVGEIFGLISIFLPFSPAPVFASISLSISGILAFLVARKIYTLCSDFLLGTS